MKVFVAETRCVSDALIGGVETGRAREIGARTSQRCFQDSNSARKSQKVQTGFQLHRSMKTDEVGGVWPVFCEPWPRSAAWVFLTAVQPEWTMHGSGGSLGVDHRSAVASLHTGRQCRCAKDQRASARRRRNVAQRRGNELQDMSDKPRLLQGRLLLDK